MNNEIKKVLNEFDELKSAYIDASSIIYLYKIKALDIVQSNINLMTISEMLKEVSIGEIKISLADISVNKICSNDMKLVQSAFIKKVPLISDDKKVLKTAGRLGLKYYNSLIILNLLLYKKVIDIKAYNFFKENLLSLAWYSDKVKEFCERLYDEIIKINQ
jgi:hypothetical protein